MNKEQAASRLSEIMEELDELSEEARKLSNKYFPGEAARNDAYKVFDFGRSVNPYDVTFAKFVESVENEG